jgi:hypothetical protein
MTIQSHGLKEAKAILTEIAQLRWAERALSQYGLRLKAKVAPYPSSQSTYRRTGTLGRRWATQATSKQVEVRNPTSYAGWVQDARTQTRVHERTGWRTIQGVAENELEFLQRKVEEEVNKIVAKHL